jgi:hypothetical protein
MNFRPGIYDPGIYDPGDDDKDVGVIGLGMHSSNSEQ